MNKFKANEVVYAEDYMPRLIVEVHKTNLGYAYDTLNIKNEIEVHFENTLTKKSLYMQLKD